MGGISKVTTEGFYKCTAKNRHGDKASAQTKIKVIGNYQLWNYKNQNPMLLWINSYWLTYFCSIEC